MAGREVQYILVNGRVREIQGTPNLNQIRMTMAGRENTRNSEHEPDPDDDGWEGKVFFLVNGRVGKIQGNPNLAQIQIMMAGRKNQ